MTDPTGKTVPSLVERLEGLAAIGLMLPEAREAAAHIRSITEGSRQLQDLLHEAQQRNAILEQELTEARRVAQVRLRSQEAAVDRHAAAEQRNAHEKHVANEWADMATSGIQWLRNVKDGTSTADEALANMFECLEHCRTTAILRSAPQAGEIQNSSSQESPSVRPQAAPREVRPIDAEMTKFLCGVVGVVEAAPYEQHMLWDENSRRDPPETWKQNSCGLMKIVGHLGEMPVCISLFTVEVGGHKLLFMNPTSRVVDHEMIRTWMKATLPKSAFRPDGYVNCTDAMNFHNVFPRALPPAENGLSGCEQDEQLRETRDDLNSIQAGGEDHG